MPSGIRRFDLYDFFSVLLPGSALVLGLMPFLPKDTNLSSLAIVFPLLVVGFVVGRSVHSAAVIIESQHGNMGSNEGIIRSGIIYPIIDLFFADDWQDDIGHRKMFTEELKSPDDISQSVIDSFYACCKDEFENLDLPDKRQDLNDESIESLYSLTRSYIHIDGRGRSRTFQAVYSFYRSMWIVSLLLAIVYFIYGIVLVLNLNRGIIRYSSIVGSLGIPGGAIALLGSLAAVATYYTFSGAKRDYQKYYIEYLFADFSSLQTDSLSLNAPIQTIVEDGDS